MAEFIRVKIGDIDSGFVNGYIVRVKELAETLQIRPDDVVIKAIDELYERIKGQNDC